MIGFKRYEAGTEPMHSKHIIWMVRARLIKYKWKEYHADPNFELFSMKFFVSVKIWNDSTDLLGEHLWKTE